MKYLLSVLLLVSAGLAFAGDFDTTEAKLKAAMDSDIRTDAEKERDKPPPCHDLGVFWS